MSPESTKDTGVVLFLCECGPILKEGLHVDQLEQSFASHPHVERVLRHATLCSPHGRVWLAERMAELGGQRLVFAACSPREHEWTFQKLATEAGTNPYLLTVANIREQVAWSTRDVDQATEKASALIRAAIARCRLQQPLESREQKACTDALVIGSGVAGLTAAQTLARAGRRVFLVEKDPAMGGRVARLSDVFPNHECASCMIEPLMDEVLHHEQIEVFTHAEVEEILGSFGNFTVRVRKRARHIDPEGCYGCQTCHAACPVEVPNEYEEGLSSRKAIYIPYPGALPNVSLIDEASCLYFRDRSCQACVSACPFGNIQLDGAAEFVEIHVGAIVLATGMELDVNLAPPSSLSEPAVFTTMALERMFNESGCTNGELKMRDGRVPASVALIHCADANGCAPTFACSKTCCLSLYKYAQVVREKAPNARLLSIGWERCVGGKGFREFAHRAVSESGVEELHLDPTDRVEVFAPAGNTESVRSYLVPSNVEAVGAGFGMQIRITREGKPTIETEVDMVVMAPPLKGSDGVAGIASLLRLERDQQGYFKEEHERLRSFSTRVEGVLVAGSAQGPKDIEEASSHGAAAAGILLAGLVPGRKLQIDPARAWVQEEKCGGCQTCPTVCPFRAVTFDQGKRLAEVNQLLCRGCGVCVAACPSAAIVGRHFTDEQILAEIESLLA